MTSLQPNTAELVGIFVGDGYLRYEGSRKEVDISGSIEEKDYYDKHVVPLVNKNFNLDIQARFFPSRNTYGFVSYNHAFISFFKNLGFPSGAKETTVRVPSSVLTTDNNILIRNFLRGYFDADGNIYFRSRGYNQKYCLFKQKYHYYPLITLSSVSKQLIKDISVLLSKLELKHFLSYFIPEDFNWNVQHTVTIAGKDRLEKWIALIGMSNPTKISRYDVWREYGFCPPNISQAQRISILKGELDPYSLYRGP